MSKDQPELDADVLQGKLTVHISADAKHQVYSCQAQKLAQVKLATISQHFFEFLEGKVLVKNFGSNGLLSGPQHESTH